MITIIDYRMGNIGSIASMIAKVGGRAEVVSDVAKLADAKKLVLPGIGHFDRGAQNLEELGLVPVLNALVLEKKVPILGICLGMQLMARGSEEGERPGLGWIDARFERFHGDAYAGMKVPHMGWNRATPAKESPYFDTSPTEPQRFYFVHSYFARCSNESDVLTKTTYHHEFCSAFLKDNICGVQFHPEKSHAFGMELFRRFVAL